MYIYIYIYPNIKGTDWGINVPRTYIYPFDVFYMPCHLLNTFIPIIC